MVEDLIDNDNLCCYYSYVCNADLRCKNIFKFEEAKRVIEKTRTVIIDLCNVIEFTIGILPNEYSVFRGDPFVTHQYRDYIILDETLINGFRESQTDSNVQSHMEVFLVFAKILRELGHALSYHCGRESGNAIERLLFGSVIDAPGRLRKDKYIIQYLILSDGKISGVIEKIWISSFVNDAFNMHKLRKIDSIEPIPFQFLTKTLKRKLQYLDWSDDDDTEYGLTCMFFKV
ncbi:unnamed protein product [Rotaria sp. Silwood1]|nr:unnamed protein product [Rotaria sp. Silwood1]CAF4999513.1 unnamed protein product [Rotaria sp. Silwood1]